MHCKRDVVFHLSAQRGHFQLTLRPVPSHGLAVSPSLRVTFHVDLRVPVRPLLCPVCAFLRLTALGFVICVC